MVLKQITNRIRGGWKHNFNTGFLIIRNFRSQKMLKFFEHFKVTYVKLYYHLHSKNPQTLHEVKFIV